MQPHLQRVHGVVGLLGIEVERIGRVEPPQVHAAREGAQVAELSPNDDADAPGLLGGEVVGGYADTVTALARDDNPSDVGDWVKGQQTREVDDVLAGLSEADRGKLIMACGTGKTFTALRIAQTLALKLAGKGNSAHVLFLVPSYEAHL